jgi:predicted ester cyclase
MSISENKEFVRRYLAAISGKPKTGDLLDLFMTDQSLKEHILAAETGVPMYILDVEEMIGDGDVVAIRGRVRGTHTGNLFGVPPTGRDVDFPVFVSYRIVNGKVVDHWMVSDTLMMLQQIGAIPAPA